MEVRLSDVCKIQYGFAFDSAKFSATTGTPLIRIRDVVRGYSETYTTEECSAEYVVNNGDLLVGMDGEFNIARWNGGCALLNQRVCKLLPKDNIDKNYLFYFMPRALKQIEDRTPFATVKHLSAKQLNSITISLPILKDQQHIASILDKLNNLIFLRKQQLAKLDELIKARFVEMFGIPGENPKGWDIKQLGDCCNLNPKKSCDERLKSGLLVSFVPMPAVSEDGNIDGTDIRKYDEVKIGFTYFAENDVLFAKITPCMENGKGAIAQGLRNGIGFGSTEFHVLRPISGKSNPYWLYTLTSFSSFRKDAAKSMTGSAGQRRVPASYLESFKVSCPPINLQEEFALFAQKVNRKKLTIEQSLAKLEVLKKSLMQEYFG